MGAGWDVGLELGENGLASLGKYHISESIMRWSRSQEALAVWMTQEAEELAI